MVTNRSRHLINELVGSVYMGYDLQRMGSGDNPFDCYEHAEAAIKVAAARDGSQPPRDKAWRPDCQFCRLLRLSNK
jgi:hypothetical protein